ncbi:uncharacterized protein LOC100821245 [Brachypodium distachyon]|uniref:Syntaxin 6/10/61 N-terminal domain-containing protein n=1 Tax=Brachypodium distachyon TaxID=15368 RepID=I1H8D1_BRADI|nr:uncharacterized protein LOC100821245 [Brachypodium distachyon]KQK23014.1 hypothetical protein BRADI_1g70720v3 [Brachypodium distachyon]PNT77940.1 hypothetical protein BRADI_1g70720v3 [Brachypodium distachyon]|eukprot:XP_003558540.1 uncharacterized protein LOC100821245 [Brachypodium distachyon]
MATSFDRWEKDPFFTAAEEVQESADRMESVYKIWVQERSGGDPQAAAVGGEIADVELRRELRTALGTAKWQLDELERAIRSNDEIVSAGKDTRSRHSDFVEAIGHRILEVENNLNESNVAEGRGTLSWIHLDDDERDDLAAFLSASPLQQKDKVVSIPSAGDIQVGSNATRLRQNISAESSIDSSASADLSLMRAKEDMHRGHRRSVSANADIGSSTISYPNEWEGAAEQSSDGPHKAPLAHIVKTCALTSALKSKPGIKYKNGAVRWARADKQDVEEAIPLRSSQLSQGLDGYSEKSKGCLNTCDGPTCNKKQYGWLGALHRRLQRSQYQIRYGRPIQLIVFALAVLIIFVCVLWTIW